MIVMGLLMVTVPLVLFLSSLGSSQARQAMHFHERLSTEACAWSAAEAGISRLQNKTDEAAETYSGTMQNIDIAYTLSPTGMGMANQTLFNVFGAAKTGQYNFTFMVSSEQFPLVAPATTRLVIPHHFWGSVEPYDIRNAADCLSMENQRGADLLALESTRVYEMTNLPAAYRTAMAAKQAQLPTEVASRWSDIVNTLVAQKAEPGP